MELGLAERAADDTRAIGRDALATRRVVRDVRRRRLVEREHEAGFLEGLAERRGRGLLAGLDATAGQREAWLVDACEREDAVTFDDDHASGDDRGASHRDDDNPSMHVEARSRQADVMLAETPDDIAYVETHFIPRAAAVRGGVVPLPAATYRTADDEWFARDVWRLVDDAGSVDAVRALFARRFAAACEALGFTADLDDAWRDYLEGAYGACLRDVTPETIVMKERLVARLTAALASPRPADSRWRARLHADIDALDGLEKPFATCDRVRFGPTSRDRLITAPRALYPIAGAASARGDLAVRLPNRPGALATFGEALGAAGCNIEGGGGFTVGDGCIVHFLVEHPARAAEAVRAAGLEVLGVREVVAHRLDQTKPGQLGATARALGAAGVNIESVYSDHDGQLILGVDDVAAARAVLNNR